MLLKVRHLVISIKIRKEDWERMDDMEKLAIIDNKRNIEGKQA
jgi:hypothetical protein